LLAAADALEEIEERLEVVWGGAVGTLGDERTKVSGGVS